MSRLSMVITGIIIFSIGLYASYYPYMYWYDVDMIGKYYILSISVTGLTIFTLGLVLLNMGLEVQDELYDLGRK